MLKKLSALALCTALIMSETSANEYPGGKGWQPPVAAYGSVIEKDVRIPMDDGVYLNAEIAYPADLKTGGRAIGEFPVIVEHMPYAKFAVPIRVNDFFAKHGYISVLVKARGLGKSDGDVQFLTPREGRDGKNIVEYAAKKLPGSNGMVAIQGCSWPGAIAINDAGYVGKNSPLKAVIASCSGMENMPRQSWMIGGMPTTSFWLFDSMGLDFVGDTQSARKFFNFLVNSVKAGEDAAYHQDYWRNRGHNNIAKNIVENDVPILFTSGWRGVVEMGAVKAYHSLQNAYAGRDVDLPMEKDQKVTPKYQLIMGGWDHGQGLDLGLYLEWLDTWMKNMDTGLQDSTTPMHVYEMGSDRWVNIKGFPQVDSYTRMNLGNGVLSMDRQKGSDILNYAEPETTGGTLEYISESFKDGATLSGPVSASIYAHSSNTNMVLIGHLYDVAQDGTETLITRGALVGSLSDLDENKSWKDENGTVIWPWPKLDKDKYLTPGVPQKFEMSLSTRQYGIKPGHKLKFVLTTKTPLSQCPVTGAPPKNDTEPCRLTGTQEKTVPGGVYTIRYGENSTLNLPLTDYHHFMEVRSGKLDLIWNEGARILVSEQGQNTSEIESLLPMDDSITHPLEW